MSLQLMTYRDLEEFGYRAIEEINWSDHEYYGNSTVVFQYRDGKCYYADEEGPAENDILSRDADLQRVTNLAALLDHLVKRNREIHKSCRHDENYRVEYCMYGDRGNAIRQVIDNLFELGLR